MGTAMTSSGTLRPEIFTAYIGGGGCLKKQVIQKAPLSSKSIKMMLLVFCFA